jgi:hypothetical protein
LGKVRADDEVHGRGPARGPAIEGVEVAVYVVPTDGPESDATFERMLFDGAAEPRDGGLAPDLSRPGLGLELKRADAARFARPVS